jgi:hypothetical protein
MWSMMAFLAHSFSDVWFEKNSYSNKPSALIEGLSSIINHSETFGVNEQQLIDNSIFSFNRKKSKELNYSFFLLRDRKWSITILTVSNICHFILSINKRICFLNNASSVCFFFAVKDFRKNN